MTETSVSENTERWWVGGAATSVNMLHEKGSFASTVNEKREKRYTSGEEHGTTNQRGLLRHQPWPLRYRCRRGK